MKLLRILPRFERAYRELEQLALRRHWSRSDIEGLQLESLNRIWKHSVSTVDYYRELARKRQLPHEFSSLTEFRETVPFLTKKVLRDNQTAIRSSQNEPCFSRRTSGSTGAPLEFHWSTSGHRQVLRARYCFYAEWGIDILDRTAFAFGGNTHNKPFWHPNRLCETASDSLRGRLRLSPYETTSRQLSMQLARLKAHRPAMLYGFSQSVYLLAREALRQGFQCKSLKAVVMTSEVATPNMRKVIEEAFGVPSVLEYGACECNLIAAESRDGTLRIREDLVLAETLPRPDGKHDIVITVLVNPSAPLIRYKIEDLTDRPIVYPQSGFAILNDVTGRNDDLVVSSQGIPIHATRIDSVFEEDLRFIRRYQVRQSSDGTVVVQLESDGAIPTQKLELLKRQIRQIVGEFAVEFQVVDRIAHSRSGKHRVVSSEFRTDPQSTHALAH